MRVSCLVQHSMAASHASSCTSDEDEGAALLGSASTPAQEVNLHLQQLHQATAAALTDTRVIHEDVELEHLDLDRESRLHAQQVQRLVQDPCMRYLRATVQWLARILCMLLIVVVIMKLWPR